jgi:hypothetical protein
MRAHLESLGESGSKYWKVVSTEKRERTEYVESRSTEVREKKIKLFLKKISGIKALFETIWWRGKYFPLFLMAPSPRYSRSHLDPTIILYARNVQTYFSE